MMNSIACVSRNRAWVFSLMLLCPLCLPAAEVGALDLDEVQELLALQQATIEELRAQQRRQQQQIESLQAKLAVSSDAPSSATGTPSTAEQARVAPDASDRARAPYLASSSIQEFPEGMRVSAGGHLNRAVNIADDGVNTRTYYVDSGNIPTFAYVKGEKQVSDDLKIGAHIEYGLQANSALLAGQDNPSPGFMTSPRTFEITADSRKYGKLWFGRGLSSSFFLADLDQAGMLFYNLPSTGGAFGGMKFVNQDTGELSDITVLQAFLDIEAINLISRVRYDLPAWNGFRLGVNVGEGHYAAGSLRWKGSAGDFDITAVTTYQDNPQGGQIEKRFDGGVGILHRPSGFNLAFGGAVQDFKRELAGSDPSADGYTVRLGWRRNLNPFGETKFAVDYQEAKGITTADDTATTYGLFVAQQFRDWNAEVYAGYRYYDLDRSDIPLYGIDGLSIGARILFDAALIGSPAQ